jgi:hypothetical protein
MWYGISEHIDEATLQDTTTTYADGEVLRTADPLTVSLRGVNAPTSHGFLEDTNDLMIVVKFQFDDQPPVDRLLYLEHDVEPGWLDDLFDDIILTTNDFAYDELNIHLQVYDVDRIDPELAESVGSLLQQAASVVTYPLLSQFAGLVESAADPLIDLVNYVNEHDRILDEKITLEVDEDPGTGHDILQPGYLVCLARDADLAVDEGGFGLDSDLKLTGPDGSARTDQSFAVLELEREHVQTGSEEINQKVAKLIAELEGKGQSSTAEIDFLRETLDGYTKYSKANRAAELNGKESLTEAEQELLDRLEQELDGFLGEVAPLLDE